MGRSISNTGTQPNFLNVTAGENIIAGDIVYLAPDGKGYAAADPSSSGYNGVVKQPFNPINQPFVTSNTGTQVDTSTPSIALAAPSQRIALLTNGNWVIAWTTQATNMWFAIYDPTGANVVAKTAVNGTPLPYTFDLVALSGGGFAVAWGEDTSKITYFAVYTGTGAVTTAKTVMYTGSGTGGQRVKMCAIGSGGFGITTLDAGFGTNRSATYNSVGTLQGSLITSTATQANAYYNSFSCAGTNNGWATIVADVASTNCYYRQFTDTGTGAVAETSVSGAAGGSYTTVAIGASTAGVFAIAVGIVANSCLIGAYNSMVATSGNATGNSQGSDLVVVFAGSTVITVGGYTAGTLINLDRVTTPITIDPTNGGGVQVFATALPNGNVAIIRGTKIFQITPLGALVGTATIPNTFTGASGVAATAAQAGGLTNYFLPGVVASKPYFAQVTSVPPHVPLGIAAATVSAAASLSVQITGICNSRLTLAYPYSINANSYGGQAMTIVGNNVNLFGLGTGMQVSPPGQMQPSGVFGSGRVMFISSTQQVAVPAAVIRVRCFGGGCGYGSVTGGTSSFGSYVSATGGSTSVPGNGVGGDINSKGGGGAAASYYYGTGGVGNYFGAGSVTSGAGGVGSNTATGNAGGGPGLTGIPGSLSTTAVAGTNSASSGGLASIPLDYIGTGSGGAGIYNNNIGQGSGWNGGGAGGGATSAQGGYPGGAGPQATTVNSYGGGFAMKTIIGLTPGVAVDVTVATPAGTSGMTGGAGLVIMEW